MLHTNLATFADCTRRHRPSDRSGREREIAWRLAGVDMSSVGTYIAMITAGLILMLIGLVAGIAVLWSVGIVLALVDTC